MATCTLKDGIADTGVTPNTSNAFTPTAGALLIVFVEASDTVQATATLSNSAGTTFTQFNAAFFSASAWRAYAFVADSPAIASSQTVTFNTASDAATGTTIHVYEVTGVARWGTSAIRQSAITENGSIGGTPSVTFASSCLTGNPTLGCVANKSTPAGITPNASWTEPANGDLGYSTPGAGQAVCHRDSGFTGTGITWGGTSATSFAVIMAEIDTTTALSKIIQQH